MINEKKQIHFKKYIFFTKMKNQTKTFFNNKIQEETIERFPSI